MRIIRSKDMDLWRHLAVEEYLLSHIQPGDRILYLWQTADAVVIGKNQNPWRECRLSLMADAGVVLARRLSGGGAVFHDRGNVNFSFIVPRSEYVAPRQLESVLSALHGLGVGAEWVGKNSVMVEGHKVSGSAFCFRGGGALHHGTLLVSADLGKLRDCLQPSSRPIRTRAIPSRPAPVANLAEFDPSITVDRVIDALAEACAGGDGDTPTVEGDEYLGSLPVAPLRGKYLSWHWCYGLTPPFEVELEDEFPWGTVRARLYIDRASIVDAAMVIDGPLDETATDIEQILRECLYDADEIRHRLLLLGSVFEPDTAREFAFWLANP